jgi:23S rRNA (uracil1939-C5)-methyltransferase
MSPPVRIVRLAAGGDGIGKLPDGRTVFVPRSAPGDLVELSDLREHRKFARARIGRVLEYSPFRAEPRCPHYVADECGGCQLQHLEEAAQRDARSSFVGDALRRLGKRQVTDPEIVPAQKSYDYRTKLTLAVSVDGHHIGLHPYERAGRVFDLRWCHITVPELMQLWRAARELRSLFPKGLEQIVLRLDRNGGRHLLFRVPRTEVWSGAARLRAELERRDVLAAIWWQPKDGAARVLAGAAEPFPATVFEQVHPEMGDRIRHFAIEQLDASAGRRVWDLYAGIGDATSALVTLGAEVESVESDTRAVAEAASRGPAARRHAARVEDGLAELKRPDLVLTNPPRQGMDSRVTAALERHLPERIVYVSCDPATLARDIARLPTYTIAGIRAFDLFPQTAHVETVVTLRRAS